MKKFTVNCDFEGQIAPFSIYIGEPQESNHPLHFQADWLGRNRGGNIPQPFMDAVGRLKEIADRNQISLEELCVYALGAAQQEQEDNNDEDDNDDYNSDYLKSAEIYYDDEDFDDEVANDASAGEEVTQEDNDSDSEINEEYLNELFKEVENKSQDIE